MMKYVFIGVVLSVLIVASGNISCTQTESSIPAPPMAGSNGADLISQMLAGKGLTRQTARFDATTLEAMAARQSMVQPHFMRYWKDPWQFPEFVYALTDAQAASGQQPAERERSPATYSGDGLYQLFMMATARNGHTICAAKEYAPAFKPASDNPLIEALEEMYEICGEPFSPTAKARINKITDDIPAELNLALAKFIYGAGAAKYYRDRALRNYPRDKWSAAFNFAQAAFRQNGKKDQSVKESADEAIVNWDLGRNLDYDDLYTGALPNLLAIMDMESFLSNPVSAKKPMAETVVTPTEPAKIDLGHIAFEFNTPLGQVAFNGKPEDNTYQGDDYFLIIDLAGHDTYLGAAAASWKLEHPISTVLDWSGNDNYISDEKSPCSQGAGILGYGWLIDNAGNDVFKAADNAQGMCYFGVGILWARDGHDTFEACYKAQGSAAFGIAYLVKKGGDDNYYCHHVGQGFGYAGGYGGLLDTGGNDRYVAEPYKPVTSRDHDKLRNYSFCQGAGWGYRGEMSGGHSMAGGIGILQDLGGDDWYECGVYGQATGYWYGTGILHDRAGNDHYEGSWFVQSGTAHMGLTMLLDEAGDDTYHTWGEVSTAGAHDFSVSWLIDKGGNDKISIWKWYDEKGQPSLTPLEASTGDSSYGPKSTTTSLTGLTPTLTKGGGRASIGSAIFNAFAVYINLGGNDTYEIYTAQSLGSSQQAMEPGSWRWDAPNFGLFLDVGGADTYDLKGQPEIKNNSKWERIIPPGNPDKSFSMGIDADSPRGN